MNIIEEYKPKIYYKDIKIGDSIMITKVDDLCRMKHCEFNTLYEVKEINECYHCVTEGCPHHGIGIYIEANGYKLVTCGKTLANKDGVEYREYSDNISK